MVASTSCASQTHSVGGALDSATGESERGGGDKSTSKRGIRRDIRRVIWQRLRVGIREAHADIIMNIAPVGKHAEWRRGRPISA